jgi:ADP-ribose pyrophosphatase YjhB (NUDIX family)
MSIVHAAPSESSRFSPRVTVATVVERSGHFLFVEELIDGRRVLNQPAGHLEANETLIHAAARETLEETGWSVRVDALIAIDQFVTPDRAFLRFAFAATPLSFDPERALDAGILQALWLTPEELQARADAHRSPLVLAGLEAYLQGVRLPLSSLRFVAIGKHATGQFA